MPDFPFKGGPTSTLVAKAMMDDFQTALASGRNPHSDEFWDALHMPEDGSKDRIFFEPSEVRIKRGRVKFPGMNWMQVDNLAPVPRNVTLTKVEMRKIDGDWTLYLEGDDGKGDGPKKL